MYNVKSLFISLTLFTLIFQGCGNDKESIKHYPTAIGESASIVSNEPNSTMAPSQQALTLLTNETGNILKTHIVELNEKEATSFTKETNYCDISGEKNLENSGTLSNIVSNTEYKLCQSEDNIQNGNIEISYSSSNPDGKFPQALQLTVKEDYSFNNIFLKTGVIIESSHITYSEDGMVKTIHLKISGDIKYNYQTLTVKDLEETITFY